MFKDINFIMKNTIGEGIELPGTGVLKPLTIKEIVNFGIEKYNKYLGLLTMTKENIEDLLELDLKEEHNIQPFDFIFANCIQNEDMLEDVLRALSLFFRTQVGISEEGYFVLEDGILDSRKYNFVVEILRIQNCITVKKKPVWLRERERLVKKAKADMNLKEESGDDISHIISAVCGKSNSIGYHNVGDLTMYQLIDSYKRILAIDNYQTGLQSLMNGASSDDVKLKHWCEKFDDDKI